MVALIRSADEYLKPGRIVPIDMETTAALVALVARMANALAAARAALAAMGE